MMPVMNGWEFRAQQLAEPALAEVPVVAFSGGVNMEEAALAIGAAGCLRKPVSRQDLLAIVGRLCARKEAR